MTDLPSRSPLSAGAAFWLQSLAWLGGDQVSKHLAVAYLDRGSSQVVVPGLLSFTFRQNTGAAFGVFGAGATILVLVAAGVIILLSVYGPRAMQLSRSLGLGLACELGGAVGNFLDRVCRGYVVDFIDIHIWPVFNLADIAIVLGALLIALFVLHHRPVEVDVQPDEPQAPWSNPGA